ncbi:MAG: Appr-1-p processing protein [Chthonomonadales bacterium]
MRDSTDLYNMTNITYITGDATKPIGLGRKIIAHVVNREGGWGKGFVLALSAVSPEPERVYRDWFRRRDSLPPDLQQDVPFVLGQVKLAQFIPDDVFVANMLAQREPMTPGVIPLNYSSLSFCLDKLAVLAARGSCSVHMPRIGCGLAGGEWKYVQPLIMRSLCSNNIPVTVYDFPQGGPAK